MHCIARKKHGKETSNISSRDRSQTFPWNMYERAAILASLALKKEVSEKYFCATLGWSPAAFQLVKYATWGGAPFQFPARKKKL